jgi:hypothetical protein
MFCTATLVVLQVVLRLLRGWDWCVTHCRLVVLPLGAKGSRGPKAPGSRGEAGTQAWPGKAPSRSRARFSRGVQGHGLDSP